MIYLAKMFINFSECSAEFTGADPETLLTGGLSYGAIFSIIDGTNCSPEAVLACSR